MGIFFSAAALVQNPEWQDGDITVREDGAVRIQIGDKYRTGPTLVIDGKDWDDLVVRVKAARLAAKDGTQT